MTAPENPITPDHIAAAQTLLDLDFSSEQLAQMLEIVRGRREQYAAIRAAELDNSVPMALNFSVKLADADPAPVPRSYARSPL